MVIWLFKVAVGSLKPKGGQTLSILMAILPRNIHSGTSSSCARLYSTHQHPHLIGSKSVIESWQRVNLQASRIYTIYITNNDVDTTQVESSSLGRLQNVLYYYKLPSLNKFSPAFASHVPQHARYTTVSQFYVTCLFTGVWLTTWYNLCYPPMVCIQLAECGMSGVLH